MLVAALTAKPPMTAQFQNAFTSGNSPRQRRNKRFIGAILQAAGRRAYRVCDAVRDRRKKAPRVRGQFPLNALAEYSRRIVQPCHGLMAFFKAA